LNGVVENNTDDHPMQSLDTNGVMENNTDDHPMQSLDTNGVMENNTDDHPMQSSSLTASEGSLGDMCSIIFSFLFTYHTFYYPDTNFIDNNSCHNLEQDCSSL